jgi:hypothetical protein
MLSDRVSGYIVMLLEGVIGAGMIIVHAKGGVVSESGGFLFVWTLFALSTTGWCTAILSARGIWATLRSHRLRKATPWPGGPRGASPPERRRHSRRQ